MKLGVLVQPTNDQVEVPTIMRALDPEVRDAVWAAIAPLVPPQNRTHPVRAENVIHQL
ncbi:MAG: hypothetical protein M0Z95_04930 [Actinomycetota bacterium]|nr:hypothetical protein [Actinomycetota bacterium]